MTDHPAEQNNNNNQPAAADGHFCLKISADKMAVYMDDLQAAVGEGKPIKTKQVYDNLNKLRITYGIDILKIDEILTTLNAGNLPMPEESTPTDINPADITAHNQEQQCSHVCIARGDQPQHGQNAELKWHINEQQAQGYVITPGELIATYLPATQGEPGKNLSGKMIPAQPGHDNTIKPGAGVEAIKTDKSIEYRAHWYGTVQVKDHNLGIHCPLRKADDGMSATMDLYKPSSHNQPLNFDHILSTLQHHEISYGIKEGTIGEAIAILNENGKPVLDLLIAEGIDVIHGADTQIEWNIDLKNNNDNYITRPGDLIATLSLNNAGNNGKDIYNNTIPALPGKGLEVKIGSYITVDENSHECHAEASGVLTCCTTEDGIHISIEPGLTVSSDAMEARLNIHKKSGSGLPIDILDIKRSLKACGIKYGIDDIAITKALASENMAASSAVVVATGNPLKNGIDGHIAYTQKKNIAGQELSGGRIDFHEHNYLWSFKKDDVIGHVIHSKPAVDGINVWGEITHAIPANEMKIELDGAHIDSHNKIIADIDGTLIINGLHLTLTDLSIIDSDVDQITGNIHSQNSVHIKGHVAPGFLLESQKCIVVEKNVENAIIRSGGSIIIKGGIRGQKSEVYTPGEVSVGFIENADVFCKGDITISNSVINSKVSSNGTITIGSQRSKHSAIIGGRITAHNKIEALVLGSNAYHRTIISVGFTQETKQQQRGLKQDIETRKKDLEQLDQIKARCQLHPEHINDETLLKVSATQEAILNNLATLEEQLNQLIQQINQAENVSVIVHKKIYPGVIIKINEHSYKVDKELTGGTFTINDNHIVFHPR